MSTFPTNPLVNIVDSRWDATFTCGDTLETTQLVGIANVTDTSSCFAASVSNLPTACLNTGRILFVADQQRHFFSNSTAWTNNFSQAASVSSTLWTWGQNSYGQLGTDGGPNRSSPGTTAGGGTNWKQVSSYFRHAVSLKSDGTLWTWGHNNQGQLGDYSTYNRSSPGTISGGGTTWCQASAGYNATGAIKTDGTLWTWGCALLRGNSSDTCSPRTTSGGGTTWCSVSLGRYIGGAIKTDGTLWMWGSQRYGGLGNNTNLYTNVLSPITTSGGGSTWCFISAGCHSAAAIKTDGTLWTWGNNTYGLLGNNLSAHRSSPGTTTGGGTTWKTVSIARTTIGAIKTDGTLWTWGRGSYGGLGNNQAYANVSSPLTTSGGGTTWCDVSMGKYTQSAAAIKTDGTLWTWGRNSDGILATNTCLCRSSPGTTSGGGSTWCQVSLSGVYSGFAIKSE